MSHHRPQTTRPIGISKVSLMLLVVGACLSPAATSGAIVPYLEEFTGIATVPPGYTFSLPTSGVHNNPSRPDPAGDPSFGPGLGGDDGAIFVDGNASLDPLSTVSFTFDGTMVPGEEYSLDISMFQSSTSFPTFQVDLMVGSDSVAMANGQTDINGVAFRTLNYTATAQDAGESLGFVAAANRPAGGSSPDLGIDWVQLSVIPIPEPATLLPALTALLACFWQRTAR